MYLDQKGEEEEEANESGKRRVMGKRRSRTDGDVEEEGLDTEK